MKTIFLFLIIWTLIMIYRGYRYFSGKYVSTRVTLLKLNSVENFIGDILFGYTVYTFIIFIFISLLGGTIWNMDNYPEYLKTVEYRTYIESSGDGDVIYGQYVMGSGETKTYWSYNFYYKNNGIIRHGRVVDKGDIDIGIIEKDIDKPYIQYNKITLKDEYSIYDFWTFPITYHQLYEINFIVPKGSVTKNHIFDLN